MKCLTFFLLLPETFKKSKKSGGGGGRAGGKVQAACYEIVPLALKRKMAAELYPAQHTDIPDNAATAKKNALQITPHSSPPPPPLHNLNNNHIDTDHWQSSHPTLRER